MLDFKRILSISKRYFFARFLKLEDLIDFSFWPVLDMIVWGGVGLLIDQKGYSSGQVTLSVLCAVMMRVFTYCYVNSAGNFLYEMMSRNIINLFATPLTFHEWIAGAMLSGCVTSFMLILFSTVVAWLIFGVNILSIGFSLVFFIIPLLLSAWAVSNIAITMLMGLGVHAQRLIFVLAWLFMPFSGVYYSLSVMPAWIQSVARFVPMSYIFEALRIFVLEGRFSLSHLHYGYALAIIYFIITLTACSKMFERSCRLGLAALERA
ncbi:MAG: ABC transporter permease [Candidatus Babeliaceae bacterium]|nr:ABC transporter permease [Candidatus Babeliaceae bacterium]